MNGKWQRYVCRRKPKLQTLDICGAEIQNTKSIKTHTKKIQEVKMTPDDISRVMVNFPNLVPEEIVSANMVKQDLYQNFREGYCFRKIDCGSDLTDLEGFTMVLDIDEDSAISILIALAYYSITIGDLRSGPCVLNLGNIVAPTYLHPDIDYDGYLRIIFADGNGLFPGNPMCDPRFVAQLMPLKGLKY